MSKSLNQAMNQEISREVINKVKEDNKSAKTKFVLSDSVSILKIFFLLD